LILAGVPLAFAMLMKPHAVMPFVALGIYAAAAPSGSRARALLWTLMPTGVLLVVYEIYFAVALMPAIGGVDALLLLPRSYAGIADSQPILNGHMPNVWYPVAWALARPGQDVWDVPSTMALVAGIQIRQVALAITVAVIAWFSFREARRAPDREPAAAMLTVCAFASFVVPALMTSAHENHPYLSSVLLLPFVALGAPAIGRAAYHAWVALLCLNVEAIYAVDPIGRRFKGHYPIGARVVVAVVAVVLSALIVRAIVGAAPERSPGRA
jgi:hypothetical protein